MTIYAKGKNIFGIYTEVDLSMSKMWLIILIKKDMNESL